MSASSRKDNDIARQVVAHAARRFDEDGNPLDAWQAISFALSADLPLPPSVRAYLLDAARKIEVLLPAPGRVDREVAAAFGLQGKQGSNLFDRADRKTHDFTVAFQVWHRDREQPPDAKVMATYQAVAAEHVERCPCRTALKWRAVEHAWLQYAHEIIPRHLQSQFPNAKPGAILKATRTRPRS